MSTGTIEGLIRMLDERRVMARALRDTNQRAVFEFLDAVERDIGSNVAYELGEIRDRELQRERETAPTEEGTDAGR